MSSDPDVAPSGPERWWRVAESPGGRRFVLGVAVFAVVIIAGIDYATGPLLSMEIFYLIPVAWATALVGKRAGAGLALASTLAGLLSDVVLQSHTRDAAFSVANAVLMLVTLLVVVELIDRIREQVVVARRAEHQSREFLAFAAHQLRTPVAGIAATADALMLSSDSDPRSEERRVGKEC